jgi:hypothetical protein
MAAPWHRVTDRWGETSYHRGSWRITKLADPDEGDREGRHYVQWTLWKGEDPVQIFNTLGEAKHEADYWDVREHEAGHSRVRHRSRSNRLAGRR